VQDFPLDIDVVRAFDISSLAMQIRRFEDIGPLILRERR